MSCFLENSKVDKVRVFNFLLW